MKKILVAVLSLILCFSSVGCKCGKNKPIELEAAQYGAEGKIIYLNNYEFIQEKKDNKVNFALYVYASGCLSCAKFSPYINEYVEENKIVLYAIELSIFNKNDPETGKLLRTPSVLIYNEGEVYEYIAAHIEDHALYFESTQGFESWFEKYVIMK